MVMEGRGDGVGRWIGLRGVWIEEWGRGREGGGGEYGD